MDYAYPSLADRLRAEWKIYIVSFVFALIASLIGQIAIPLGPGKIILFPIFYSIILGVLSGPEVAKVFDRKEVKAASKLVIVAICPFIAKIGVNAGAALDTVVSAGPALFSHAFADVLTIFITLPVALLLGLGREAVGAASSINRETNLAIVADRYGADSAESRGSLAIYVVGGMLGTIYFGLMASVVAMFGIFDPLALGLASGVGAGIMMAAAVGSLGVIYPGQAEQINALAGASQTIAGIDGVYLAMFVALPLTEWLYERLSPAIGRKDAQTGKGGARAEDGTETDAGSGRDGDGR